ncbi:hypothetical protein [Flavobacterium sp. WG21]|uniref:hypothetical protein n=1 Tax=Flavobacterium sp. WG21 TaxID=1229487 RepID=UPI0003456EEE|nr:hypothetical protein [Flavobacterium sp. WG21]
MMSSIKSISTSLINTLKDSDINGITTEWSEVFLDTFLEDGIIKEIPIISTIIGIGKTGVKINEMLFLKKILYFISQLNDIPAKDREKVIDEIDESKKYRIKIGEKLLYIIDKCDDHEKSEIIGKLFSVFLKGSISYESFVRCAQVIERSIINELEWFIFTDYDEYSIETHSEYLSWGLLEFAPFEIDLKEKYSNDDMSHAYELDGGYLTLVVSNAGKLIREHLKIYSKDHIYNSIYKMSQIEIQNHIDLIMINYLGIENAEKYETATLKTMTQITINEILTKEEYLNFTERIIRHSRLSIARYDNYIKEFLQHINYTGTNYNNWLEFCTEYKKIHDYIDPL